MIDIILTIWLIVAVVIIGLAYGSENKRIRKEMKKDGS